ncbi:bile acid:sodium symporter family protein [Sorangium sp. So ce269]
MGSNLLTAVLLPLVLAGLMLGLGLSLTFDDFRRVLAYPRAVGVGLLCQIVLLPLACIGIAHGFRLEPELAVGLMVLAASPGGAAANIFSHLAHGDLALNITLTAVSSVLALVSMPLLIGLSFEHFLGVDSSVPLLLDKVVQVMALVLAPVALGMAVRARRPTVAVRLDRSVRVLSAAFLLLVVAATLVRERHQMSGFFRQVGLAALTFNLVSLTVGYLVPRLVRLGKPQAIAISMEVGIHNAMLAITLASSPLLLNRPTMAIPAAVYSLFMLVTAALFALAAIRSGRAAPGGVARPRLEP